MVIGKIDDTRAFGQKPGYQVLDYPAWNVHVNDGWVNRGILEGRSFQLVSEPSFSTLRSAPEIGKDGSIVRETTIFFRELKMLRDSGYIRQGNMMVPRSASKGPIQ